MLGARLYGKEDLRLEEMEIPQISEEEVLVKIKSAAFYFYQNFFF